jgi:ADP-L-glycero-D-manno-heptose 6-epimerase
MWLTLRRVMAGETIRLFKCYRADFAAGERAAAMLWMRRHASESGVFNIGTGTRRSFRDLMLALGAACGRAPVIAYVDMPEAMRPLNTINM